jgi:D-lactate dehydrogenase
VKLAVFSTKRYDERYFRAANERAGHEILFLEPRLDSQTARLAAGFGAVCPFVNDTVDAAALTELRAHGTRLVALRSAGYNHVDVDAARRLGMTVARVPAYSPAAVAEHTLALILTLDRKIHRAHNRVREGNFSLDGLVGFDLGRRTVGIVGTGRIGATFARLLTGFGCRLLAHDPEPDPECRRMGVEYVPFDELLAQSHVVSLHCPLTPATRHLIGADAVARMRPGVMLVNTSRGALVDTRAVIQGLKSGRIGYLALDVYEEEADMFFEDLSNEVIRDDVFARLLTFPNVLVTAHQAFFTDEALRAIAETTLANVTAFERGEGTLHLVPAPR